jgi:integrase
VIRASRSIRRSARCTRSGDGWNGGRPDPGQRPTDPSATVSERRADRAPPARVHRGGRWPAPAVQLPAPGLAARIGRRPGPRVGAIRPGMHFHDLRHAHKAWLIEDGVPQVLQHQRLGTSCPARLGSTHT